MSQRTRTLFPVSGWIIFIAVAIRPQLGLALH
jgi:hypothetical protein